MLASEKGGDLTILTLRLKAATPSQEKVSHSVLGISCLCLYSTASNLVSWLARCGKSGRSNQVVPCWGLSEISAGFCESGILWILWHLSNASSDPQVCWISGSWWPASSTSTRDIATGQIKVFWGLRCWIWIRAIWEEQIVLLGGYFCMHHCTKKIKKEHVCVSSMVFVYWILAHAWSKNGLVQRGCWDRHRNCWEQVLQGVADVQADWPQEAVLVPEHRSATFASLRFMLCWKVRLLWRVLHSRSTAREAACWSRVFGSGFEFRLNAEFENCYELIFLMAHSAWDWCWIFHMVDEFGIPRSANFGLEDLTCCRTSCPNWCSVQSWNPREWWFLPERAVPQGKYEVKWSIWWTSLGKKYQNTPTIRSWDLLSACFLNAGHVVSGLPPQGCEYKHPHNFIVHCGILVWQEL